MKSNLKKLAHNGIALVAPITVPYQRKTDKPASYFIGSALREILRSASLEKEMCDGLLVSSFSLAPDTVASLAEAFDMCLNWAEQVPLGGASGVIGLRRAARSIEVGDADIIACIGGDTFIPEEFSNLLGRFSNCSIDGVNPYASGGANLSFALLTRAYMEAFNISREDFGKLCILQRGNARRYRNALFKESLSLETYLGARVVAEPLGLFDCVMPCAGAEGFLMMREVKAMELGLPYALLRASGERHNASNPVDMPFSFGWKDFKDNLYDACEISPEEIDIVQVYDDYPVMALLQLEELGFCAVGQAAHRLSGSGLIHGGKTIHVNTSGGQLSSGQAGFAGGFLGLVEAVRQLTGSALGNQFTHVKRALVSGFGMINYDRGLCAAAAILESAENEC